mmetsp:Transcript_81333/g.252633  ORF Transcript_81333/g.252633 Transcript_81333/m.252633 type:complete len:520 (+) Transcript_81333:3-1562(+)
MLDVMPWLKLRLGPPRHPPAHPCNAALAAMMAISPVFVSLLLLASAAARPRIQVPKLHHGITSSIPMRMYSQDCWQRRRPTLALSEKSVNTKEELPGAGMEPDKLEPFTMVLKDGFFEAACVKDYLHSHGDKFGKRKYDYKLGEISNVSIVHYTEFVAPEDRQPMTHEVCFEFCRTVPDMLAFGIFNGGDCYCAPFFEPMASDDSSCDIVCEGNPTQMCGSKIKSSIFEMHECADTGANLLKASTDAESMSAELKSSFDKLETLTTDMGLSMEKVYEDLVREGDLASAANMRATKSWLDDIGHVVMVSTKFDEDMKSTFAEARSMSAANMKEMEQAAKAETLTEKLEKQVKKAGKFATQLDNFLSASTPSTGSMALKLYYPLMYFVDKSLAKAPITCSGDFVGNPMSGISANECAAACETKIKSCVGFSYYTEPGNHPSLCYLFSKIKQASVYTGCDEEAGFLQRRSDPAATTSAPLMCMAKLSRFEGTNVKPDGSGRCVTCLKKIEMVKTRCPSVARA